MGTSALEAFFEPSGLKLLLLPVLSAGRGEETEAVLSALRSLQLDNAALKQELSLLAMSRAEEKADRELLHAAELGEKRRAHGIGSEPGGLGKGGGGSRRHGLGGRQDGLRAYDNVLQGEEDEEEEAGGGEDLAMSAAGLVALGYSRERVAAALQRAGGDVGRALDELEAGGAEGPALNG
eukprot:COSAG04_NODE_300_length_17427_cov_16.169725_13_plen_180_part_00